MPYNRSIDLENIKIFLSPTKDETMFKGSSPGFSFTENAFIKPLNPNEFEFIQKRWFDIIVSDLNSFNSYKIGSITGYLLDIEAFEEDIELNGGHASLSEMDGFSQIMCDIHGLLTDETICDIVSTIRGDLYILNNIVVEKDYEHPMIEMAAIHLIPYAFEHIYQSEIGGILYTLGMTELDDDTLDESREDDMYFKEHEKQIKTNGFELVHDNFYYKPVLNDNWKPVDAKTIKKKGGKESRTPITRTKKDAIAAKKEMAAAIQASAMPGLFGPSEKTEENTKDVLILVPGKRPEWVTVFKDRTAELYFEEYNSLFAADRILKGHFGNRCTFAFHTQGETKGWKRNISIGVNILFQDIHGPIIFYHEGSLSFTEEDIIVALQNVELPLDFDDHRTFKDRKPFSLGKNIAFEDLIEPNPMFYKQEREVPDNNREKFFIQGYFPLSTAVYHLLKSGYGRFIVNYAHQYERNPIVEGFKTKEELMHYAAWSVVEFTEIKNQIMNGLLSGRESEEKSVINASRLYYLIKPIEDEIMKLKD